MIDAGYKCENVTDGVDSEGKTRYKSSCTPLCGDGEVSTQYKWDVATNSYKADVIYNEACDLGTASDDILGTGADRLACSDTCEVVPGWQCTTLTAAGTSMRYSECKQTCGDGTLDTATEVCDTGNAQYTSITK